MKHLIICILAVSLIGCSSSKISTIRLADSVKHPVGAIAMMPGGGVLADAVGVELLNLGFKVIDASSTTGLMARLNLNEIEITKPYGLQRLRKQGIDAVLMVRSAATFDQTPQSASARMSVTSTGQLIAGVTWQNGFGGQTGSVADRMMRKGLNEAAQEIASALAKQVSK